MSDPITEFLNRMRQMSGGAPTVPTAGGVPGGLIPAMPEWAGGYNGGYVPGDIGTQQSQMNFVQDQLNTGMDPLFAMLMGGGFNMDTLSSVEEEVTPAVTQGRDRLMRIIQTSMPDSNEALIAAGLLDGMTPSSIVQRLEQEGRIVRTPMVDDFGAPIPNRFDTSEVDRWTKWAEGQWNTLLDDREEQRTVKEVPSEFLNRLTEAGFSDPRQQYTAEVVNRNLPFEQQSVRGGIRNAALARSEASKSTSTKRTPPGNFATPRTAAAKPKPKGNMKAAQQASKRAYEDYLASVDNRAKAEATARFLRQTGRSPFQDEWMARMGGVRALGVQG